MALVNICFNVVEINHMAVITTVAESVEECAVLSSMRTVFSFLSGVYIYSVAWGLLGQDSEVTLGPNNLSDFAYLSWIAAGTGVFFATLFLIGTKEPQRRVRRRSTFSGIMRAPEIIVMPQFGRESAGKGSSQVNLAHRFVDMIMASSQVETYQHEHNGHEENQSHEQRDRRKSLLQKFAAAIFSDGENETGLTLSVPDPEEGTKNPDSEDAKSQMCLEVQQLDRERKKSLLVRLLDGLLLRPDQEEQEQAKFTVAIEDEVTLDSKCERCVTDEDYYRKEEIETFPNEKTRNMYNNKNESGKAQTEEEEKEDDKEKRIRAIPETSMESRRRQRKHAIVNASLNFDNGLSNFGFEYDKGDDAPKGKLVRISVRKPKKSVTFRAPEIYDMPSVDEGTRKNSSLVELTEEETIRKESAQKYVEKEFSKDECVASCEGNNNSSALDDNLDLESHPVPSDKLPSMRKPPKGVKDWLRDPNLYKVAIIFTCSYLAQDSVYGYLPLYLTERLLFAKEAIAYFPIILLVSASFSSSICNGLNKRIGSKWSYLLAGSIVIGCAVWSYFQTISTRQSTYAQVIIMGSGLSIIHVMALVFITELIGENKETSGSVFAIITVISRLSSGGLVIGIQKFYPEERTSSNGEVSNYVRHVFAMAPGILTLVGSLLVLLYQPSNVSCRRKGSQDVEAQAVQSSSNVQVSGCPSENEATSNVSLEANQSSSLATVYSSSEDTKL
ncbi:uncharacterized protein LOC111341063 isoform X2 [Stylophora pistillata]|nr:uncharacterized protein LOC111341063 isoform X2 [Stylophora pistillata]